MLLQGMDCKVLFLGGEMRVDMAEPVRHLGSPHAGDRRFHQR